MYFHKFNILKSNQGNGEGTTNPPNLYGIATYTFDVNSGVYGIQFFVIASP